MHRAFILPTAAASFCLVLSACDHIAGSGSPQDPLTDNGYYYDTQVIIGECISPGEAALLPVIASAAIAQGVNRIGDAIKAAAEKQTNVVLARRNIELREGQGLGPCVMIARGWYYRSPPDLNAPTKVFRKAAESGWRYNDDGDTPVKFWRAGLLLAATPDFFYQGRIVASVDGTAYSILPIESSLDEPISWNILRPSGKRSVLVSIALSDVGKPTDLQKGGGSTMALGSMEPGNLLTFSQTKCFATKEAEGGEPIAPFTCPESGKFDTLIHSPFESEWFAPALTEKSKPMMLQALVSETRDESKFLAFVADVFGATKATITEELQQALIPSVRETAKEAERAAQEKAANDFDTALSKAITELNACVGAPKEPAKRVAARMSLRSLIQAARKADRSLEVSETEVEDITTDGQSTAPCEDALAAVLKS